ncbi:NAD(P)/FAD-dependent oxidoreductase [Anaerotalea alkaliphila]|uniref:NAD(P)/FAD-dependent oxidoreductase n=1 Tax=Anaerotalea alkaliphila TaxID=2662126 RepID=UPI001FE7C13E|nr:FAD-dependent oxidoreductase [Anaerotalea alkaliphila]
MTTLLLEQIKMPLEHGDKDLEEAIRKKLGLASGEAASWTIAKKAVDARKAGQILIVYNILVELEDSLLQGRLKKRLERGELKVAPCKSYRLPPAGRFEYPPVVVGAGPAGLFAAYILASCGARPLVLERGKPVEERHKDVEAFFGGGPLQPESNIQFGEGGAGTYSDGKLNTGVKDPSLRKEKVLEVLLEAGAPEEIGTMAKPHIGTDRLLGVVASLRQKIIGLGGEFRFQTKVEDVLLEEGRVSGVLLGGGEEVRTRAVVLAIGHSARDTFAALAARGIPMERKAFAVGLRIEHPQEMISRSQYGSDFAHPHLPVAEYKLSHHAANGRGVYTFCMCPGGFVVNSSSEPGGVVCNGMSYFNRGARNANSALLASVHPEDFPGTDVLAGVAFQREWEQKAFHLGGGNHSLPVQLLGDFLEGKVSEGFGEVQPNTKGRTSFADLNRCLPPYVAEALKEALPVFDRKIRGFARKDAVLTGVETRSSSPVRILRGENCESPVRGLFPCGEGAGYAGGIMSAAMDGIKVAESVLAGTYSALPSSKGYGLKEREDGCDEKE